MQNNIEINAKVTYLPAQSNLPASRYAFAYTITITNKGTIGATLLTRHWYITDDTGDIEEVIGDGVVGYQPHLTPGESFQYSSGAIIKTATGSMKGSYGMKNDNGETFNAEIPEFILSEPYTVH